MDTARCTLNGITYTALEFASLSEIQIGALRQALVCTECGGPGYFRRASRSGHAACFGARPHDANCGLAVRTDDPWGEMGDDVVQQMEADNTRIILSGRRGDRQATMGAAMGDGPGANRGRRFTGADAVQRTEMRRNADNLLRMVSASETFRNSGILIATTDGEVPARDFFVPLAAADRQQHIGRLRGFWGTPIYTNVWNGLRIFNGGPRGSLGVEVSPELAAALIQRYNLADIAELRTRMVMFIGRPRITTGDSFMMDMTDSRYVGVLPATD